MPTFDELLARGFLPKELPSPFNSREFAQAVLGGKPLPSPFVTSRPRWTSACAHVLGRPGTIPRLLNIPNPVPFYRLAQEVVANWSHIDSAIRASPLSLTAPVDDPSGVRALVPAASFERTAERAELRAAFPYIVVADIAQFYPSVYTHSLAWALHTKAVAKRRKKDRRLLGNRLDRAIQVGQDGQTSGIPIGPDTSLVMAELVLSECDQSLPGQTRGFRYFDDYELYFSTHSDAERALTRLRHSLSQYNLSLNSHKTKILSLPQPLQDEWITQLRRTELRARPREEQADLTVLFDDAFRLAARFPDGHVVSYALGLLQTRISSGSSLVHRTNWPYLQRLLLQSIHAQTGAIQKAAGLLQWGHSIGLPLDLPLVGAALNRFMLHNASVGQASEVTWGLWTSLALGIRVHTDVARKIAEMNDDAVALVALHARSRRNFGRAVDVSQWRSWLTTDQLDGEHWLVAYEAAVQGWLTPATGGDHIAGHEAFDFLRSEQVHFYDRNAALTRKARTPPPKFAWRPVRFYE